MTGSKIPVLTSEKFTIQTGGRGLNIDDDASNFDVVSWVGTSGSASAMTQTFLPAPSAIAWWKVTGGDTAYFIPLFREVL